jgi:hypothetical protein
MNLLGTRFVSRLLLSFLIAHDTLVGTVRRLGLRLRHALLTTMFAALILHTFQVVLTGHRHQILFCNRTARIFASNFPSTLMQSAAALFRRDAVL